MEPKNRATQARSARGQRRKVRVLRTRRNHENEAKANDGGRIRAYRGALLRDLLSSSNSDAKGDRDARLKANADEAEGERHVMPRRNEIILAPQATLRRRSTK